MADLLSDRVLSALRGVDGLYHRLVLVVGKRGSGKTAVLQDVASKRVDCNATGLNKVTYTLPLQC